MFNRVSGLELNEWEPMGLSESYKYLILGVLRIRILLFRVLD